MLQYRLRHRVRLVKYELCRTIDKFTLFFGWITNRNVLAPGVRWLLSIAQIDYSLRCAEYSPIYRGDGRRKI